MTINSTPSSTAAAALHPLRSGPRWLAAEAGMLVAGFVLFGIPAGRRRRMASVVFVLALLGGLPGCGGGASGGTGGGQQISGTTTGTYTFMVEGSFTATIGASQPQVSMVNVTIQ
jgi:hypothetical protein